MRPVGTIFKVLWHGGIYKIIGYTDKTYKLEALNYIALDAEDLDFYLIEDFEYYIDMGDYDIIDNYIKL